LTKLGLTPYNIYSHVIYETAITMALGSTWVKLTNLAPNKKAELIENLTIAPYTDKRFGFAEPEPVRLYMETGQEDELIVPRHAAPPPPQNSNQNGGLAYANSADELGGAQFTGQLRPIQQEPFNLCVAALRKPPHGGVMMLPCGFGKTPLALAIVIKLGIRAIVVVHRDVLLTQWIKAIADFTTIPPAQVGQIGGGVVNIPPNCTILIAMVQTLIRQPPEIVAQLAPLKFAIFDEVDVFGSTEFSRVFRDLLSPTLTLGMSATPTRRDGCHRMFHLFLGPMIFKAGAIGASSGEKEKYRNTKLVKVLYKTAQPWTDQFNFKGGPLINNMYIELMADPMRMAKIITTIREIMTTTPTRHLLVLTARREQVDTIANYLEHPGVLPPSASGAPYSIGRYMGGISSAAKRTAIFACRIIVATVQSASVGMNIPTLDTLFLTLPVREMEQACGRIGRGATVNPLMIYDLIDTASPYFVKWSEYRAKLYRKLGIKNT